MIKQVGKRWHVVNGEGETVHGFATQGEALKHEKELEAAAKRAAKPAAAPAPVAPPAPEAETPTP